MQNELYILFVLILFTAGCSREDEQTDTRSSSAIIYDRAAKAMEMVITEMQQITWKFSQPLFHSVTKPNKLKLGPNICLLQKQWNGRGN